MLKDQGDHVKITNHQEDHLKITSLKVNCHSQSQAQVLFISTLFMLS